MKEVKETVDGKHKFKGLCNQYSITIKNYRADNHIYNSQLFRQSYSATGQGLLFSGVNTHHQNSIV